MKKALSLALVTLIVFSMLSILQINPVMAATDEYFIYSRFDPPGIGSLTAAGGYIEYLGVPEWGDEIQYVYFLSSNVGYKVRVEITDGDGDGEIEPRQHPDHYIPKFQGPIEPRHYEIVSSWNIVADTGGSHGHTEEFHIDSGGVYLGAYPYGIHKWDHDWNYLGKIANSPPTRTESMAYNPAENVWYAGGRYRTIYQLGDTDSDGSFLDETWVTIFTYPNYGGNHHDGMEYVGGYLWISDMTSDVIGKWEYNTATSTWNELNRFTYTEPAHVEGMGFGPNFHFWCSYSYLYELGNEITSGYPLADAGDDVDAHPPTIPVEFDASGSHHTDPAKELVLYEWDFESDGAWDYSGTDLTVEYAYPAYYNPDGSIDWSTTAKDYTATLRVTDNSDPALQDTDTCIVHITAPPWKPVADPNGPYESYVGVSVQLDGSGSYDPETSMFPPDHPWYETIASYEWDLDNDGEFDDATGSMPTHTWTNEGIYTIRLKVTDSQPSGPGGTVGPLDFDTEYASVVILAATHKVVYIPVKYSDDSHDPTHTIDELEQRAQLVTEYYEQQSYGSVKIANTFIFDDWESLGKSWSSYDTNNDGEIGKGERTRVRDDAIDLAVKEKGLDTSKYESVVVIQPDGEITSFAEHLGGKKILTSDRRIYATWAHELGHTLFSWHDYYGSSSSRGDVDYWALMAKATLMNPTSPVMSYNKEKAGWLSYHTIDPTEYGEYTIEFLNDLEYEDEVQRYQTSKGSVKYFIFEGRDPPDDIQEDPWDDYPDWNPGGYDYELEKVEGILLYQVEPKDGIIKKDYLYSVPPYKTSNNDKVTLNSDNPNYLDADAGVEFSMKKEDSTLKLTISGYKPKDKAMMSLSNVVITGPELSLEPVSLESSFDVDLHAYSDDGQHVGMVYSEMQYECEIDGTEFRNILGGGSEYIALPESVSGYFMVDATLAGQWCQEHPHLMADDIEITADIMLTYFDNEGIRYESSLMSLEIIPGEAIMYRFAIVQNPDGTYTPIIDNTPPLLTVITPPENAALQDGVTLSASAWDENGVSSVTFSIREPNGEQGTVISPEFEFMPASSSTDDMWELPFDTTLLPDGYYLAYVEATDVAGNVASDVVPFSIRNWACLELLPASRGNKAGRTMPVKFSLRVAEAVDSAQPFVYNEELTIRICEEGHPDPVLQESTCGDTARDYRIDSIGELYITNFRTIRRKPTTYVVEIYRKDLLVGSFTFETVK